MPKDKTATLKNLPPHKADSRDWFGTGRVVKKAMCDADDENPSRIACCARYYSDQVA